MSNAISSIGVKVGIALETISGTKPTTGYKHVPEVTELPNFDFEPDTIETTSLDNVKYKSYIEGLIDTGGILSLTANFTTAGVTMWDNQANQETETLHNWLVVVIPNITQAYYIPINAIETGVPNIPVNDKIEITYKFTVIGDILKDDAPTFSQ